MAVRAGVQRRRPRALRSVEPAQPARPARVGLARHRAEPQPQSRLRQGRFAGDAGDAAAGQRLGPAGAGGPARHQRGPVRTRHRDPGRAAARRRRCAARDRPPVPRRGDGRPRGPGLAAAAVLSLAGRIRQPGVRLHRRRLPAALLHRLLPAAQPALDAGGNAFLEGVPGTGADDPQHHRLGARPRRPARPRVAARRPRGGRTRSPSGRRDRAAGVRSHGPRTHHRFPRLRLDPHAVGRLRRADDPLRRNHASAVAGAAARRTGALAHRTGPPGRLRRARSPRGLGGRSPGTARRALHAPGRTHAPGGP